MLTAGLLEAYQQLTKRILAAWHDNDPLDRFPYGDASPTPPPAVA